MNFMENGGYTMALLNESWGIKFFYGLCIGITVICIGYFMKQGWISGIHMPKMFRKYFSCFIPKKSILQDNNSYGIYNITDDELNVTAPHTHNSHEMSKMEEQS